MGVHGGAHGGAAAGTQRFIMASRYQNYVERASKPDPVGTLLSVITVTGLLYLITSGLPPADLLHR